MPGLHKINTAKHWTATAASARPLCAKMTTLPSDITDTGFRHRGQRTHTTVAGNTAVEGHKQQHNVQEDATEHWALNQVRDNRKETGAANSPKHIST
jgi:hypothetical protein